jgi:glc operon protein GlcG
MRRAFGPASMLAALATSTQHASAQLGEKKVLTLAAVQEMVAAAEAEAERNHLAGAIEQERS